MVARHADRQVVTVGLERHDVLEGGEPDRFGELVSELVGDRRPHLLLVAHLHLLPSDQARSTRLSTACGQSTPVERTDATTPIAAPRHETVTRRAVRAPAAPTLPVRRPSARSLGGSARDARSRAAAASSAGVGAAGRRRSIDSPEPAREAHLPTEHPPPGPQARLPRPDAHAGRPLDPQGPAAQGPRPPVGLIGRIHERRAFERLTRDGRRARTRRAVVPLPRRPRRRRRRAWPSPSAAPVGTAVARNRLRRRLRALLRDVAAASSRPCSPTARCSSAPARPPANARSTSSAAR